MKSPRSDAWKRMKDPWRPTGAEIRAWAADPEATHEQDWDLCIVGQGLDGLFLELAADPTCPNRMFFLRCLYILAADYVRSVRAGHPSGKENLDALLREARTSREPWVMLWAERAQALIANPDTFKYGDWYDGILARKLPPPGRRGGWRDRRKGR